MRPNTLLSDKSSFKEALLVGLGQERMVPFNSQVMGWGHMKNNNGGIKLVNDVAQAHLQFERQLYKQVTG